MKKPIRPALPALLFPLALCWFGIVSSSQLVFRGYTPSLLLVIGGVIVSIVATVYWLVKKRRLSHIFVAALVLSLAFGSGSLFYDRVLKQEQHCEQLNGQQNLVVVEDTRRYASSCGSEALVDFADGEQVRVRIFWNDTDIQLPKGSHIAAYCTFSPLRSDQQWLMERGIIGTLSLAEITHTGYSEDLWGLIDSFRQHNVERICSREGEGAALVAGVLLGYREELQDSAVEQDFVTCGLSHLIAVSGSHLAVVAALLSWFLRRMPLSRISETVILIAVLILYVMLTGLQPSAIRSAIMAGIAGCSVFVGRRGHAPSALTAAALVMMLIYPVNAYSLGFWLSVFAVIGITLYANLIAFWVSTASPLRTTYGPGALSSAFALTIAASTATLPLVVSTFAVLSCISPFANLLVTPLVTIMLATGMVALVCSPVFESLGNILLDLSTWISEITVQLAALLMRIPGASIPVQASLFITLVLCLGVAVLVYLKWPLPSAQFLRISCIVVLACTCLAAHILPQFTPSRLVAMDVGQGDALLVQEQGHTVLIDTGASDSMLVKALARNRVGRLDAVIITHLDEDHTGALGRLRGLVPIEKIYFATGLLQNQEEDKYIKTARNIVGDEGLLELSEGDQICIGKTLTLCALWPKTMAVEGSNSESICLLLQYDEEHDGNVEQQALLTGDAESTELNDILQSNTGLTAAIIKIGHHGSKNAITAKQLEELQSAVALISVGSNNRYGHPATETLSLLEEGNVKILRTDERGDIACIFHGTSVEFRYATIVNELY